MVKTSLQRKNNYHPQIPILSLFSEIQQKSIDDATKKKHLTHCSIIHSGLTKSFHPR